MKTEFILKRFFMSLTGVLFLGPVVALLRKSGLGTDPWTCFVVGMANIFHSRYGILYPVIIGVLLVIVLFVDKHYIGIATVLNLLLIGPLADQVKILLDSLFSIHMVWQQVACLAAALLILCIASSLYITANLGVSSYDAVALIMADKLPVTFRWCRIGTDIVCTLTGFLFNATIGIGTVLTAFFMGPATQFCCVHIAQPLLGKDKD
jgi:uncharacterized protein